MPSVSYAHAVEEALCFEWIDSLTRSINATSYQQYFTRRKVISVWSKINKEKVTKLIAQRIMTKAGYESIGTAKQNGSWNFLDEVGALIVPQDLKEKIQKRKEAGFSLSR